MITCTEIQGQLGAYLARTISSRERKTIQDHLAECPSCQAELESLARLHGSLRQSMRKGAALSQPDPRLRQRVKSRVSQSWRGGTTEKDYRRLLATGQAGKQNGLLERLAAFVGRLFAGSHWVRLRNFIRSVAEKIRSLLKNR